MNKTYTAIKTVKLVEYPLKISTLSGFALYDTEHEELVSMDIDKPYMPAGGQSACDSIVESGLSYAPDLYVSSDIQRLHIEFN